MRKRSDLFRRQSGRPVRPQLDGARAEEDLLGHEKLHRREARDGRGK